MRNTLIYKLCMPTGNAINNASDVWLGRGSSCMRHSEVCEHGFI